MAKKNTIANNGLTVIENYNNLFTQISRAQTVDEVRAMVASAKEFISLYKTVDKNLVNRIYEKLQSKMNDLLEENEFVYQRTNARVEEVRNRTYDFTTEKDDTQAVQAKLLQLMAKMPKVYNNTNANRITKELNDCINSGVVGSKAVLELLKYPAYADRVSTAVRERAFEGSKSPAQKAFENGNAAQLRENEQALASVYMQGFHLRIIAKQVTAFKKPSAWNPEDEAV